MRKFRGQLFSGEWIYGYYAVLFLDGHDTDHIFNGEWNEVKHGTVGQFTGLKDKNGVEIYEGDIIGYPNENVKSIVKFGEYKYNPDYETHENGVGFYLSFIKEDRIEGLTIDNYNKIIGNIYENPELLGDKNDS